MDNDVDVDVDVDADVDAIVDADIDSEASSSTSPSPYALASDRLEKFVDFPAASCSRLLPSSAPRDKHGDKSSFAMIFIVRGWMDGWMDVETNNDNSAPRHIESRDHDYVGTRTVRWLLRRPKPLFLGFLGLCRQLHLRLMSRGEAWVPFRAFQFGTDYR